MDTLYTFKRHLPVYDSADVVVIGGGPSGVGAAIGAARCGKKVILTEQSAQLGGMATLGGVAIFMYTGNYTGIYREIREELADGPLLPDGVGHQFNPFRLRLYLNKKCAAEGVKVMYHTRFIGVMRENKKIAGVAVNTREGLQAVAAPVFIDCTGDARVAVDAGAEYSSGRPEDGLTQPTTLMFTMQDTGRPVQQSLPPGCPEYNSVEELPQGRLLHWERTGTGTLLVNMTRVKAHGAKIDDVNMMERETLKQLYGVVDYLQRHKYPNHILSHVAPQTGVRQTMQVKGEYTLTADDLLTTRKFDDTVAQTDYNIDIHDPAGGGKCEMRRLQLYDIPYRCMVPRGLDNVLVSGRAISADHVAMSSIRVMPTCYALGQAAGVAAAIAVDDNAGVKDVDYSKLRKTLEDQGVKFD